MILHKVPRISLRCRSRKKKFQTFKGVTIGIISDSTRAKWEQQLSSDDTVKKLTTLKTEGLISAEAYDLILRKLVDGYTPQTGRATGRLDGKIGKSDLEFLVKTIDEMREKMTQEDVLGQVDRAISLGGIAQLRSLKEAGKLADVRVLGDMPLDHARLVMLAFAGNISAIETLESQVAAVQNKPRDTSDSSVTRQPSSDVKSANIAIEKSFSAPDWTRQVGVSAPIKEGSSMALVPTGQVNQLGNPIYALQLYENGECIAQFKAVSGRASTQGLTRTESGNNSPLPDGDYQVTARIDGSANPEVGVGADGKRWFIPISSSTQGKRSALGIHYDPSYEKKNGEDGTAGCIGLTSQEDGEKVRNWIMKNKPSLLRVDIA